jgi:phosphatidylserine decarboxylase
MSDASHCISVKLANNDVHRVHTPRASTASEMQAFDSSV